MTQLNPTFWNPVYTGDFFNDMAEGFFDLECLSGGKSYKVLKNHEITESKAEEQSWIQTALKIILFIPLCIPMLIVKYINRGTINYTITQPDKSPLPLPKEGPLSQPRDILVQKPLEKSLTPLHTSQEIQEHLEKKKITLLRDPAKPTTKSQVDEEAFKKYVDNCKSGKEVYEKIFQNLQHLTMDHLNKGLQSCVAQLNAMLGEEDYAVGYVAHGSTQWVASLALPNLTKLPSESFSFEYEDMLRPFSSSIREMQPTSPTITDLKKAEVKNLVIFDDCIYGGYDMEVMIMDTIKGLSLEQCKNTRLFMVSPFISDTAKEVFNNIFTQLSEFVMIRQQLSEEEKEKISVISKNTYLITSDKHMTSVNSLFATEEEKTMLSNSFTSRTGRTLVISAYTGKPQGCTTYTDWGSEDLPPFLTNTRELGNEDNIVKRVPFPYAPPKKEQK